MESLENTDESLSVTPSPPVVNRLTGPIQLLNKILQTWRLEEAEAVPLLGLEPSEQGYAAEENLLLVKEYLEAATGW